jgi:asparagine synthase (glutamine-hydrolysing)
MCGIAGYYSKDKENNLKTIFSMSQLQAHRGPDDEGFAVIDSDDHRVQLFSSARSCSDIQKRFPRIESSVQIHHTVAFAHQRYSIIDLSSEGHQPFIRSNNILLFNGEIYNYIELKDELRNHFNKQFFTNTDSEVVLAAFEAWGTDCFKKLNGFFAIVIYSINTNSLIFARDRIGKAPLYYTFTHKKLYWSSDIKPLLFAEPSLRSKINQSAVDDYLQFGIRDYNDKTFWEPINTFPAATYAVIDMSKNAPLSCFNFKHYWQFPSKRLTSKEISIPECTQLLTQKLESAIAIRLRSDIPIGFTLSGGLDSSAIAAFYAKNFSKPSDFLCVKYDNPRFDESEYARLASSINSNVIKLSLINGLTNTLTDDLDYYTNHIEEPYHSPVLYTDFALQKILKQKGYGVMINGGGADELFAGYEAEYILPFIQELKGKSLSKMISEMLQFRSFQMFRTRCKIALNLIGIPIILAKTPNYQLTNSKSSCLHPKSFDELMISNFSQRRMNYWLRSGNKSYMGVPLEPRMPFLDHEVVDFGFTIPIDYLINHGWHKFILRKCVEPILPSEVVWRKVKMGFPFDLTTWLNNNSLRFKNALLTTEQCFIDKKKLIEDYDKLALYNPSALWRYISFTLWFKRLVKNTPIEI